MSKSKQCKPSCLDSAYERHALAQGWEIDPVFEENKGKCFCMHCDGELLEIEPNLLVCASCGRKYRNEPCCGEYEDV